MDLIWCFFIDRCQTVLKKVSYVTKEGCHVIRACTFDRLNTVTRKIISCPHGAAACDVVIVLVHRATIP